MKTHAKSHTHCQVARKSRPASQNLSKSMSFANAPKEMRIVANLKDKMTENKECQCLTKAIRNLGNVLVFRFLVLNKISRKLKMKHFRMPNAAYSNRCIQGKKNPNYTTLN